MRADGVHLTIVHHNDPVCGLDTGDTLGNDQLRGVGDLCGKGLTDLCIRCRIHCAGAVI